MLPRQARTASSRRVLLSALVTITFCVGDVHSALGAVIDSGSNTPNPTDAGASPSIGLSDVGRLTINGGHSVSSNVVTIGDLINGFGIATVTDFNPSTGSASRWFMNSLFVGDAGTGRLEILNGALVSVDYAGNPGTGDLTLGNLAGGVGTVIVDGLGTILRVGDDTNIGVTGSGTLRIVNDGFFIATNDAAVNQDLVTVGARGRVELDGGRLRAEALTNNGVIIGSGRIDNEGIILNSITGRIEANAGERLVVNAIVDNDGDIAVRGGEIEFLNTVTTSNAAAEVTLRDGAIARFPIPEEGFGFDMTTGVLSSIGGTNDIYGTVRIQGAESKIIVAGDSTAVFHDPVTNDGGVIDVLAGSTPIYHQGLTIAGSGSVVSLQLTDPVLNPNASYVQVSGPAQLAGKLAINLAGAFVPSAGDAFQIVTAAGGITGSLQLLSAPALPGGMQWDLHVNTTSVMLSVVSTGDYNGDGTVDAADYVVWRNARGQTGRGLAADANGNGVVDAADYDFWRSRIGTVVGSGAASPAGVPEPGAARLLSLGGVLLLCRKRK